MASTSTEALSEEKKKFFMNLILEQLKEQGVSFKTLKQSVKDNQSINGEGAELMYYNHMADMGTDAQEKEKKFFFAQRGSDQITRLEEALQRIENGTYGICLVCGEPIGQDRLEAVPVTQKCINCKKLGC